MKINNTNLKIQMKYMAYKMIKVTWLPLCQAMQPAYWPLLRSSSRVMKLRSGGSMGWNDGSKHSLQLRGTCHVGLGGLMHCKPRGTGLSPFGGQARAQCGQLLKKPTPPSAAAQNLQA